MKLLVLKHARNEGLGAWEPIVRERTEAWRDVEVGEGEEIPPLAGFDGVVSLGGPMSADDDHPGLVAERALLVRSVEEGVPVLGVCLGAQLLAHTLGARIYSNPAGREVGVSEVFLTEEGRSDPLFAGLSDPLPVLQWHGDAFDLPAGAKLLATAPACENQAFRFDRRGYGVLFHPEVREPELRDWLSREDYREYAAGAGRSEEILAGARRLGDGGVRLFENWLDLV